jgi:hypothetical protein
MIRFRPHFHNPSCPAGWKITRALSQPEASADVVRHLRDCPACAQLAVGLRAVISAAAEMPPVAPMSQAARDRTSQALSVGSAEATPRSDRRRRMRLAWALAAGLAGVAVVLCGWLYAARQAPKPQVTQRPGESAEGGGKLVSLAKIRAFGEARFRRLSGPPDETVRLESGHVAFEVSPLTSEQRFRVVTRDGEVEVRGCRHRGESRCSRRGHGAAIAGRRRVAAPATVAGTGSGGRRRASTLPSCQASRCAQSATRA